MSPDGVSDIMREGLFLAMILVSVIIIPSLCVGLVVSVFQAATQINEQTLSFLPRLLVTMMILILLGPWLGGLVLDFTSKIILELPALIG